MIAQYVFYAVVAVTALVTNKLRPEGNIFIENSFDRHNASSRVESSNLYVINERNLLVTPISWNRYFDKRAFTASMGLAYRRMFDSCVIGLNSFFDISNKSTTYQLQNSVGCEVITDLFEFRMNFYLPWKSSTVVRRNYQYSFPKAVDAFLVCNVTGRMGIFFNPVLTTEKEVNSIRLGLSYHLNDYTDISVYGGRDLNKNGIAGMILRFGLYENPYYAFSPVKRRHDIHFIKTAIKKPPERVSSVPPSTPPVPAQDFPDRETDPPLDESSPEPTKDPFFLWRWLGFKS